MARIPYSSGDSGGGFTPLPNGTYDFRIEETIQGVSKAGNNQLQIKMEVLDGPHTGKKMSVWYSLLDNSLWKLKLLLKALNIEGEDTGRVDDKGEPILDFDDEWLVGRCVTYDVTQREYNGRTNNNFDGERMSPFDEEAGQQDAQQEEEPQQAALPAAQPAPNTMRRRPRPQRGN